MHTKCPRKTFTKTAFVRACRMVYEDSHESAHRISSALATFDGAHEDTHTHTTRKGFPRDPPVQQIVWRVNLLRAETFTTAMAKHYRECSDMLLFIWKKRKKNGTDSKTTAVVKYYGSKCCSILSTEGSLVLVGVQLVSFHQKFTCRGPWQVGVI